MTIYSMTGYASADRDLGHANLHLELKSVNGRFLDLNFRCGDELRFLEMPLREKLTAAIGRGKLDCRLYLQPNSTATPQLTPNLALVAELGSLDAAVRGVLTDAKPLAVADVLRWPGVLAADAISPERLQADCFALLDGVLGEFLASRAREGARLADVLDEVQRLVRVRVPLAR